MGLREILGGDWSHVGRWLLDNYASEQVGDPEFTRRTQAKKRRDLFENNVEPYLHDLIEKAFANQVNRELRDVLVKWAKWNNVIARVVKEKATVYSEQANRRIGKGDEQYQKFLRLLGPDQVMREVNRQMVLHEDVWLQYRVTHDTRQPVIDVVTPDLFAAIAHPADPTRLVGILLWQKPWWKGAGETVPHYRLWTATETIQFDKAMRPVGTEEAWPLGRLPGVLASAVPASARGCLLAKNPSSDLVAAHESVTFQNVLLLKESKSVNRQNYLSGDTSQATRGQVQDTESDVVLGEGVGVQTVDRGVDLSQYRDNADHMLERAAANHGLPPSVLHHRDASSGAEIELRRIPIRELRQQQVPVYRRVERELAEIQSLINAKDLTDFAFSVDGWSIDFGEVQAPQTERERLDTFEKARQLFLTDTVEEIMHRNPDHLTPDAAIKEMMSHITAETLRVAATQQLAAMGAGPSTPVAKQSAPERDGDEQDEEKPPVQ